MALEHAQPGQAIHLPPLHERLAGHPSHALIKTHALELIHLVLPAGREQPAHRVYGEITLHCLEGELHVHIEGAPPCLLRANDVVLLPANVEHAVRAVQDSSALLTVQIPPGQPGSGSSTL
jgi:quercetin dioxygenase-like cupin family protein